MGETRIKICGLFHEEDIEYANQVKPDFVGFILAPGYRRSIAAKQAAAFRRRLDPDIQAVGVFVDSPREEILYCLEKGIIQMAQLHGAETEEEICRIREISGRPVLKAVTVRGRQDVESFLGSRADYLVFDKGTGTGAMFDWKVLEGVERSYFLAGGLNVYNLGDALETLHPYAVDISSGAEENGVKSLDRMRSLVRIVRSHPREKESREILKGDKCGILAGKEIGRWVRDVMEYTGDSTSQRR